MFGWFKKKESNVPAPDTVLKMYQEQDNMGALDKLVSKTIDSHGFSFTDSPYVDSYSSHNLLFTLHKRDWDSPRIVFVSLSGESFSEKYLGVISDEFVNERVLQKIDKLKSDHYEVINRERDAKRAAEEYERNTLIESLYQKL